MWVVPRCWHFMTAAESSFEDRNAESVETRLSAWNRRAPPTVRTRFGKRSEITGFNLFNIEASIAEKRRDVSGHVAAFKCKAIQRFSSPLPQLHRWIRRKSVLEKDELSVWFQDSS